MVAGVKYILVLVAVMSLPPGEIVIHKHVNPRLGSPLVERKLVPTEQEMVHQLCKYLKAIFVALQAFSQITEGKKDTSGSTIS